MFFNSSRVSEFSKGTRYLVFKRWELLRSMLASWMDSPYTCSVARNISQPRLSLHKFCLGTGPAPDWVWCHAIKRLCGSVGFLAEKCRVCMGCHELSYCAGRVGLTIASYCVLLHTVMLLPILLAEQILSQVRQGLDKTVQIEAGLVIMRFFG